MAKLDQSKTPYVDALKTYISDDVAPFDVPGHHMDCLALSITDGLCFQNIKKRKYFFIAGVFALGQFLFPLVGHFVGLLGQTYFTEWFDTYDHWIAFVLLCFIGGKMLYEGIKGMIFRLFTKTMI